MLVTQDDSDGDFRIEIMDEAARGAGRSLLIFVVACLEGCPAEQAEAQRLVR
jgi:hypothetical protein